MVAHEYCYHRGRGEHFRLGSDAGANIKMPHKVEGLAHKKIVQVAVGAMHCLALTDNGEVSELRERENVVCVCVRKKECVFMCAFESVCERERECLCVCVCCLRKSERERSHE